jgi:hypothetical protein
VTGLTVDQWQTGVGGNLFAVDGLLEVFPDLVVGMAAGKTVLVADKVGHEIPDHQAIILFDGFDGVRAPQLINVGAGDGHDGQNQGKQNRSSHNKSSIYEIRLNMAGWFKLERRFDVQESCKQPETLTV